MYLILGRVNKILIKNIVNCGSYGYGGFFYFVLCVLGGGGCCWVCGGEGLGVVDCVNVVIVIN